MKTIDKTVSDLCEEIDLLKTDRDLWKNKYEECSKRFREFVDQSIKNGEVASRNWLLYVLNCSQKKYKVAWKNDRDQIRTGPQVFNSWDECQKECERLDMSFPTIRHWPKEI